MKKNEIIGIAKILTSRPEEAAAYFQKYLMFKAVPGKDTAVQSGSFQVAFCQCNQPLEKYQPDAMLCGLRHIAIETDDIANALAYFKEHGLRLQTNDDGKPRFNPKVYGTGLHYFNILTDYGVTIEITQKHTGSSLPADQVIWGLGHIGIQVSDLESALNFYEGLGFSRDFPPVENETVDGPVQCCMMTKDGVTLEIYAFLNHSNAPKQISPVFASLTIPGLNRKMQGPGGELLE